MIAKENINCSRYKEFSKNVNVQDVEKCRRAVSNNSTTHKNLRGIKDRLSNRFCWGIKSEVEDAAKRLDAYKKE